MEENLPLNNGFINLQKYLNMSYIMVLYNNNCKIV